MKDAVSKGAKVLLGGQRLNQPGYFYPPTVLGDYSEGCTPAQGRDLRARCRATSSFDTEAEVIAFAANDTELGLVPPTVYTRDLKRGFRVCEQIDTTAGLELLAASTDMRPVMLNRPFQFMRETSNMCTVICLFKTLDFFPRRAPTPGCSMSSASRKRSPSSPANLISMGGMYR